MGVTARDAGVQGLSPGEITFCVLARAETDEAGRLINASIGLARPADADMYGYISEHHGFGMTGAESGDYAEDLAATMLASTLGIDFDPDAAWTKKGGRRYFGYKVHVGVDQGSAIIRRQVMTPANVNDTEPADLLICGDEAALYGDQAYTSAKRRADLRARPSRKCDQMIWHDPCT